MFDEPQAGGFSNEILQAKLCVVLLILRKVIGNRTDHPRFLIMSFAMASQISQSVAAVHGVWMVFVSSCPE